MVNNTGCMLTYIRGARALTYNINFENYHGHHAFALKAPIVGGVHKILLPRWSRGGWRCCCVQYVCVHVYASRTCMYRTRRACTYIYVPRAARTYGRAAAAARRVKTRGCWEAIVLAAECCSRQDATAPLSSLVGIIAMGKLAILPRDRHPVRAARRLPASTNPLRTSGAALESVCAEK